MTLNSKSGLDTRVSAILVTSLEILMGRLIPNFSIRFLIWYVSLALPNWFALSVNMTENPCLGTIYFPEMLFC